MPDAGTGPDIIDGPAQPSDRPKITTRYMTKYERARILGTRASKSGDTQTFQAATFLHDRQCSADLIVWFVQHECTSDG